jgi:methionyl-tRNA formyltransferase
VPQPDEEPSFYPKRTPDDGALDWTQTTQAIDRLVRAVAPPYPGAFCELDGARLLVEAAQPFEGAFFESAIAPGTIVDVSPSMRMFVVKTGDGSLLVTRYSGAEVRPDDRGRMLTSRAAAWTESLLAERYGPEIPRRQWEVKPTA